MRLSGMRLPLILILALGAPGLMPQRADSQTLIPLPLSGDVAATVDQNRQDQLDAERFDPERHRGNHVEPVAADPSFVSPLRPIEARGRPAGSAIRFDGERRTLEFALFVPNPAQMRALRVSTLSSINVLPERSHYLVYVNETLVGEGELGNFTDFGAIDFPVSTAAVLPGQNHVRIELIQYHRIYCGPEASFALWSDIDLANSGAVLGSAEGISGQDGFMMGIAAAAATGTGIEIRGAEGLAEYRDAWISQLTQRISAALGGDPIPFRFTEYWSVQGQARSAARITFIPSTVDRVTFRTSGDGAQVMLVEFAPGERPHALPEFENILPRVAERSQPALIATQRPVAFSEFGFRTTEVRDRYALIERRFRLPDDYVVLTNAKAEIALDYIYVPDLPDGAMLLVHINGTNVRLLPLRGEGGQLIEQFPVRFEARLLRAGINTLTFESIIPGNPADLPCPTQDEPMLAIGQSSTLTVPFSPSMYLADMHIAFTGLTPGSVTTNDMSGRAFDDNDVVTLRAALSGGENPQAAALRPQLHLLSIEDLGSIPTGHYQFSRRAIETTLLGEAAPETAIAQQDVSPLLRATERAESTAALARGWAWITSGFETALQWLHPRSGMLLEHWLEQHRGQAVLLQLDPARPNQLWLLRAPGSDISAIASAIVAARTNSEGPRGQVSVLDRDGHWQSWIAPDREPVLLEPVTLDNVRYVVGNFVSAMPMRYVVGLFFIALVSALVALRLVIATREHRQ
ncbi:MAG: cellulose biosynthesis cyclic di-GMP-binding regulatory protein BcsB [Rhodobacter sp.]|nr:cellulose biosynthesis cyclic di-GMP-binding regulatory protein BcsB [Paracoccaceae bacterium]MCC0075927.1 cellulose biosynthesis cyclic di-GMP-binding regulatory protein BcsB [Rhodobacter sp.]